MTIQVNQDSVQRIHQDIHAQALKGSASAQFLRHSSRHVDGHWRRFIPKLDAFSRSLGDSVFVDYGCKFGHLIPLLVNQGVRKIYAVDVNDRYLDEGQTYFGDAFPAEFIKSQNCYVDIASNSADFVLANEMISHINSAFLDTFYAEVSRILKPGGELVISDGNNWCHLQTRLDLLQWYLQWEQGHSKEFGPNNYVLKRRHLIATRYPQLAESDLDYLARNTSGLFGEMLVRQIDRYLAGGVFIERPHRPGICPTHPGMGTMMERAFDPRQVLISLEMYGFDAVQIRRGQPVGDYQRGQTKNFTIRGTKLPETIEALSTFARSRLAVTEEIQPKPEVIAPPVKRQPMRDLAKVYAGIKDAIKQPFCRDNRPKK